MLEGSIARPDSRKGGVVDGTPSNITRRGIVIFDVTMTETPLLFPVPHPQT
jgi:hypothetical protein